MNPLTHPTKPYSGVRTDSQSMSRMRLDVLGVSFCLASRPKEDIFPIHPDLYVALEGPHNRRRFTQPGTWTLIVVFGINI